MAEKLFVLCNGIVVNIPKYGKDGIVYVVKIPKRSTNTRKWRVGEKHYLCDNGKSGGGWGNEYDVASKYYDNNVMKQINRITKMHISNAEKIDRIKSIIG